MSFVSYGADEMSCTNIEMRPTRAQSSRAQAKPSDCTRTASNKPNQQLLDDVPRGVVRCLVFAEWFVVGGNAKPKRAQKHLPNDVQLIVE